MFGRKPLNYDHYKIYGLVGEILFLPHISQLSYLLSVSTHSIIFFYHIFMPGFQVFQIKILSGNAAVKILVAKIILP